MPLDPGPARAARKGIMILLAILLLPTIALWILPKIVVAMLYAASFILLLWIFLRD